jgi:8-oxo-dGTP diphosphatase
MIQRTHRYQAAIVERDHVLLLQVVDAATGRRFWLLPGGGIEAGESDEECLRREVFEETSLRITVEVLLFECPDIQGGMYERLRTYRCRVLEGEARPGREPEVDTEEHVTIRATGWFDLRRPQDWDRGVRDDTFTMSLLDRLRVELGYVPAT